MGFNELMVNISICKRWTTTLYCHKWCFYFCIV